MAATCWWIGLGGFLGTNARYLVGQLAVTHWGVTFWQRARRWTGRQWRVLLGRGLASS